MPVTIPCQPESEASRVLEMAGEEHPMKETLKAGIEFDFRFPISVAKTVPALYPEAAEFQVMPEVFATGFMVGFIEWACVQAVNPHIDWPAEQTVGIHINVAHVAATPPGMEVRAQVKLIEVDGRRLVFEVAAFDESGLIGKGFHERMVIDAERFNRKIEEKARSAR
jgi:fluoroacetyl-CoA thioesterase